MQLFDSTDGQMFAELLEYDVVRKGFDGLMVQEGLDLVGHIVLNAEAIDSKVWLEWLTSGRQLIRLATLTLDAEWIRTQPRLVQYRQQLCSDTLLPAFETAGTWVCAALRNDAEWLASWERTLGASLAAVAPTPKELRDLRQYYL